MAETETTLDARVQPPACALVYVLMYLLLSEDVWRGVCRGVGAFAPTRAEFLADLLLRRRLDCAGHGSRSQLALKTLREGMALGWERHVPVSPYTLV